MTRHAIESNLRTRVENLFRTYRGILILANALTPTEREKIDRSLAALPKAPRSRLKTSLNEIKREIEKVTHYYGFRGSLKDIENILSGVPAQTGSRLLYLSKLDVQQLFDRYERALPIFAKLPLHARISIDVFAINRVREVETFQLEAALFEDMAALSNALVDAESFVNEKHPDVEHVAGIKRCNALMRAVARAVFSLLEGVLNCIALDILKSRSSSLSQDDKDKLEERDSRREKPRLLSLRDKLLQYPRIALKSPHPSLQETNCPEMAFLLGKEETIRHALIHPTPLVRDQEDSYARESTYLTLSMKDVGDLCDSVISLIEKLLKTVGPDFGDPELWIHRRGKDGRFPPECFT